MNRINHQFKLAARPVGAVKASDWQRAQELVPDLHDGDVLIQNLFISIDPAMRGWMNAGKASYIPPVGIGEVMRALAVGKVLESRNNKFTVGDHVSGLLGVQTMAMSDGHGLMKVDPKLASLPTYLSTLGSTGLTAYFGLLDVGKPKANETVVVSGAAGAVGSVVGQIAKIQGCRVIGIAGGVDKCRYLVDELGFDAAIDYKAEDVAKALAVHAPKGVDIYFDNVGGDTLDAVLTWLARGARVVLCGAISQYNSTSPTKGPANYLSLLMNRATMTGIVGFDYFDRAMEAMTAMSGWMASGQLKSREDIVDGLDAFPMAFDMLFSGANNGKLVLRVTDPGVTSAAS